MKNAFVIILYRQVCPNCGHTKDLTKEDFEVETKYGYRQDIIVECEKCKVEYLAGED